MFTTFNRSFVLSVSAFLFILFSVTTAQTTVVKGKLLDVNGKPNKFALVGLANSLNNSFKDFVKCDTKGNYEIKLIKPGINYLMFSMPSHSAAYVPVINNKEKEVTIDVNLATYKYVDNFDEVGIAGNLNGFDVRSPQKMEKQSNGAYSIELITDKPVLIYQLVGITKDNRTINAPETDEFEPDSSGDYRSIMKVKDGKVTVVFNPAKLLRNDTEQKIVFKGSEFDEKLFVYNEMYLKLMKDVNTKIDELLKTGKDYDDFMYDNSAAISEFKNKIETENDPLLKNCLKLMYVYFAQYKTADYDMNLAGGYYESVPPENEAWEIIGVAYFSYYKLIPQYKWGEIEDSFLNKSKSDFIKLQILRNKLSQAKYRMNETKLKELHELILRDFSDNEEALQLLSQYPIETKIKIGSEIPDFEVVSLDDANVKFSKKDMLGKIYMIDFWAVWCGPCVAEMDGLHKAYEKYKDKGLEILSLSFDGSSDDVIKFRKDKWKMPWKHSFVNNGFESKIAKDFEVDGIPKPILISADGKILALSNELRGEDLDKTLALYFK